MSWYTLERPGASQPTNNVWRRRLVKVLLAISFPVLLMGLYFHANKSVILNVDGTAKQVQTLAVTVADLLREQDVVLHAEDLVEPGIGARLKEGQTVTVTRAVPVTLLADGEVKELRTLGKTVKDVLGEAEVVLGDRDLVVPEAQTPVSGGMSIKVVRVNTEIVEREAAIPFATRQHNTPSLNKGETRVARAGKSGLEKQRWEIAYHDGREVGRNLIDSQVVAAPVDRVVQVGTLQTISRGGQDLRFSRVIDMVATAYTYTGNNTASGVPPRVGGVAVDTSVIPMGSRLYVEGYGYAVAIDRGSAIKGNKIDVFLETWAEARQWGVKRVKVYVLE